MTCIALNFAELCSTYPAGGGLRMWNYEMLIRHPRTENKAKSIALFSGCMYTVGSVITIAATNMSVALSFGSLLKIVFDYGLSKTELLGVTLCIMVIHLVLNCRYLNVLSWLNKLNVFWSCAGLFLVVILLSFFTKQHQNPLWVFTHFENQTGFENPYYVFVLGMVGATYSLFGAEGSAAMTEETENANIAAPIAIVTSITMAWVFGCIYLVVLLFSIQDLEAVLTTAYNLPVTQVFMDALGTPLTIGFLLLIILCQFCSGSAIFTICSRQVYNLARNGRLPYSPQLQQLNSHDVPGKAIFATFLVACCVLLPYPLSDHMFMIIVSAATISVCTSYSITLGCKLFIGTGNKKGRFHLGRFSKPVNIIGFIWALCAVVAFALPTQWPVTVSNANYAGLALCVVVCLSCWMVSRTCH
ncbi:unnamed protein product [Absidia cylindrospora]